MTRRLPAAVLFVALLGGVLPATAVAEDLPATFTTLAPFDTGTTLQQHHPLTVVMSVGSPIDGWTTDATLTLREDGKADPWCVVPADVNNAMTCQVSTLAQGEHVLRAEFSGNTVVAGSVSDPMTLEITPDLVEANGFAVGYALFYPVKDGYRDTVAIKGNRLEPLSVVIRIYNSKGARVALKSIGKAAGAYRWSWNGRNAAGSVLPTGTYRVVQSVSDGYGSKPSTAYVKLSLKKLAWTTTTVTKNATSLASKGTTGSGKVVISTAGGYVKLTSSGNYVEDWAGAGWAFTLPAGVAYKSLKFGVYFKGGWWAAPNGTKLQNFTTCPSTTGAWQESCFDHDGALGSDHPTVKTWTWANGSASANRKGRLVRGMVSVGGGTFSIYKVQVKVTYAVLK